MIQLVGVSDHEWLRSLYEDRLKWVPVYLKDAYFAGIGENLHPFFDKYIHKQTPLKEFLDKYELALHKKHKEETLADIESRSASALALRSRCSFELQEVPGRYVLSRWRKDYKRMYVPSDHGSGEAVVDATDRVEWLNRLHRSALRIVEEGLGSVEGYDAALQAFEESLNRVHEVEERVNV
ncbi:unnamed protein product [Linum tenue]|uniref:Protein FAR1-RELATED SEQUENCE n=1 Tax=Linum tenue TaxID=586396 RepID=A0AAV0IB29_9ROSI|nr:unnamed protein product [Linum tenue]CAI0394785.1 unnamed protein product [Linum tenue]